MSEVEHIDQNPRTMNTADLNTIGLDDRSTALAFGLRSTHGRPGVGTIARGISLVLLVAAGLGFAGCMAQCGGSDHAPCPAGTFCKLVAGVCSPTETVGVCIAVPQVCTEIFSPVCGCDGATYSNACVADAAGVNVDHEGECGGRVCGGIAGLSCNEGEFCKMDDGQCCCDFQGVCVERVEACIQLFDPVCGCDGNTFANACEANIAGVNVDHTGACSDGP